MLPGCRGKTLLLDLWSSRCLVVSIVARSGAVAAALALLLVGIAVGYLAATGSRGGAATVERPSVSTVTRTVTNTLTATVTATRTETTTTTTSRLVVEIVDALGRVVTLNGPAKRVVSLAPSITEEIVEMNATGRLVGADSFSKKVPGVPAGVADVGGYWNPSAEKILSLRPDLVLACSGVPSQERLARQLEEAGTRVFFTRCDRARDWRDIEWDVEAIGRLLGAQRGAEKLVAWMESRISGLEASLANTTRPKVALLVYLQDRGAWVAGGGTFQDTLVSTAAAVNVFHGLYGWQMVSYEDIVAKKPDFVVATAPGGRDAAAKTLAKLSETPIASTSAWRTGHVCVAYGGVVDALNRPAPRAVLAAEALASLLHPGKAAWPKELGGGFLCNRAAK